MFSFPAILPDAEIRAMQGAAVSLASKGIEVICLSSDSNCLMFNSSLVAQKLIAPSSKDGDKFIDFLVEKVPRGVLYPSNDRCALIFSQNKKKLTQSGFLINVPCWDTFVSGFDKWECSQFAKKLDISCAKSYLVETVDDVFSNVINVGFPFIIKATRLAGGNYTKIFKYEDIPAAFDSMLKEISRPENIILMPRLMVQSWLNYEMEDIWCSESYYCEDGSPAGFMSIRKDRTVLYKDGSYGSRLYAGESIENEELTDLTRKLLNNLNWRGFAHLDWIYSQEEKRFYLMEINPRLPGFSFFPFRVGFDTAYYYYADLVGDRVEVGNVINSKYFEILRYPGDLSSTIVQVVKGKYSFNKFIMSYFMPIFRGEKIVIDLWCKEDLKISFINIYIIIKSFLKELLIKLKHEKNN